MERLSSWVDPDADNVNAVLQIEMKVLDPMPMDELPEKNQEKSKK